MANLIVVDPVTGKVWVGPGGLTLGISVVPPLGAPTGLTATVISSSEIDLSWVAPVNQGQNGISGYDVNRDGTIIATVAGLTYNDTGLTAGSVHTYMVRARDNSLPVNTGPYSSTVNATTIAITNTSLPNGVVNTAYNYTMTATGGVPPYTWSITAGKPTWMSINTPTGVLTGTPTGTEVDSITFKVADSAVASTTRVYSLTVSSSQVLFPRVSWWMVTGSQNFSDYTTLGNYGSQLDILIIGAFWEQSAAGNGWNRATLINTIASTAVSNGSYVAPKVLQYGILDHLQTNTSGGSPNPATMPIWYAKLNSMSSYWYTYLVNGSHALTGSTGTDWRTNAVDLGSAWRDSNGNNMEAAYAVYDYAQHWTSGTADAAPNMAGPWHDNYGILNAGGNVPSADWLHTGVNLSANDATVNANWRTGCKEWVTQWRSQHPSAFVCGNVAYGATISGDSGPIYTLGNNNASTSNLWGVLDASMAEAVLGPTYAVEHFAGFDYARRLVQFHEDAALHPEFNQFGHYNVDANGRDPDRASGTVGQALRYGMCMCLTTCNAAYTFFLGGTAGNFGSTTTNSNYTPAQWFDYFSVDPTTGVALDYLSYTSAQIAAARRYLGIALDSRILPGVQQVGLAFYRRFYNSITNKTWLVIVNPSPNNNPGAATQVINLTSTFGGTWKHVTASTGGSNIGSNSSIDTGASVSSVSISAGDGVILFQ